VRLALGGKLNSLSDAWAARVVADAPGPLDLEWESELVWKCSMVVVIGEVCLFVALKTGRF
jgi:hypothetical protein